MFSWAPKPQHLESYLRLRKCSLLASERNPGSCSLHLHMWVWTRLPSPAGWPGPQSPRPGGSWAVPLVALAVDVTQRRHTAETSVRVLSEGTPSPCLFCTCLYSASSVWGVSTKGGVQDTSGGASVLTEAISVPPPVSPHLCSSLYRLPRPLRLHVHEPIGSLVHREANGQPPQLHGHPSECPPDPECGGAPPQCPGFSIPSHHVCHGPTLGSAGCASRTQSGRPAQLPGRCPSCRAASWPPRRFSQAAPGAEPAPAGASRVLADGTRLLQGLNDVCPQPGSPRGLTTPRGPGHGGPEATPAVRPWQ